MSERTPRLSTIRHAWAKAHPFPLTTDVEERYAEFDRALAAHDAALRAEWEAEQGEPAWEWSYVEKWADGTGVYSRVTFDTEKDARRYLHDIADHTEALNKEATEDDRVVASLEKRHVTEPGPWMPVDENGDKK